MEYAPGGKQRLGKRCHISVVTGTEALRKTENKVRHVMET